MDRLPLQPTQLASTLSYPSPGLLPRKPGQATSGSTPLRRKFVISVELTAALLVIFTEVGYRGFIDTPMTQALSKERLTPENVALKRVAEPEEVAKFISFLLSDESSYITGAILNVDGGWMC